VSALVDVQALGHAITAAEVLVTRSTARAGDDVPAPGAYRPAPAEQGPRPDPAPWSGSDATSPDDLPPTGGIPEADREQDD
jgi:hypothetical protein